MAEFTGILCPGDITTVHSRTVIAIGTRVQDTGGNEYIFLRGVSSCIVGSWVTYDEDGNTTLLAANALGPVAIAMGAINTSAKMGWFQIYGTAIGCVGATIDVNDIIGRSGSDGYVGDGPPAGDYMYGAICRSAIEDDSPNTTTTFTINYPFVDDGTAGH